MANRYDQGLQEALALMGVKTALHAEDRRAERTPGVPASRIPQLQAAAKDAKVPEGMYHLPLHNDEGKLLGHAAFKTVEGGKLVLATVLGPNMKPKGQRIYEEPKKEAALTPDLERRFGVLQRTVREHGALAGTAHNRILIPHNKLTEQDINDYGFTPVTVAIPEAGQNRFQSFRHPDNNFHIHSHDDGWTMHEDGHSAATMLAKKEKTFGGKIKAFRAGIPHASEEGLPGLGYYIKGRLAGHKSTAHRVLGELNDTAIRRIDRLKASPTYQAAATSAPVMSLRRMRSSMGLNRPKPVAPVTAASPDELKQAGFDEAMEIFGVKLAKITTPLQDHQKRLVEKMQQPDSPGQIAVWGLGSGKSLGAIASIDALGGPADVVAPAALGANFKKEIAKHTEDAPDMNVQGLENTARKGGSNLTNDMLVVDEAHRLRNPGKTRNAIMNSPAKKKLLLTGSLVYNHPGDIAGPLNALVPGAVPSNPAEFNARYVTNQKVHPGFLDRMRGVKPGEKQIVNPERKAELQQLLQKYVDYHPGSKENFPERTDETIRVPMSEKQREIYQGLLGEAPSWVKWKVRSGLPPSKAESADLNQFLSAGRQLGNTSAPFHEHGTAESPKIDAAFRNLQQHLKENPRGKAVVYSNYLQGGLEPYKAQLQKAGIPFGEYTGEVNQKVRDQLVNDYNSDKVKALLLSGAGGEGLDLKGTSLMQLMEPHWNSERGNQVIGRGIRYKSHEHLPPEERRVRVQQYLATLPRKGLLQKLRARDPDASSDEYLHDLSKHKEDLLSQFRELYKPVVPGT